VALAVLLLAGFWWRSRAVAPRARQAVAVCRSAAGEGGAQALILESRLTCPLCGHASTGTMPTDACQYFYDCKGCGAVLKPKPGDCCVYCSYGTVKCPPIQAGLCCRE
jgi:hypothetical protein